MATVDKGPNDYKDRDAVASSSMFNSLISESSVKEFREKLLSKSIRFVLCSQVWHNALPTRNCDVLVTLHAAADLRSQTVATWLTTQIKIREPRLHIQVRYHTTVASYGLYLTARYDSLLKGAEELQIRKPVVDKFGGGLRNFVYDSSECFVGVDDRGRFLTSQERSLIVLHFLNGIRAQKQEIVCGVQFCEGQAIVPALRAMGFVSQVLPLHDREDLNYLQKSWVENITGKQPLDKVCEYFGEKIGMYFAWLGHYTSALCIPAFFGLFHWLFLKGRNQIIDDVCVVLFAVINILWATLFLESWKRRQAELSYRWGTLGMDDDLLVDPRPQFRGCLVRSTVTGRMEMWYPSWKRHLIRYLVSYPITAACLALVFAIMLLVFELQEWTNKHFLDSSMSFVVFVPKIVLALVIAVCDELYGRLAVALNNLENYRLDHSYENHLITKILLFQFVNSFLSLFYIAFILCDMDRLRDQLAALLITRQVIGNLKEVVMPLLTGHLKLGQATYKMTKSMSDETLKKHVENIIKTKSNSLPTNRFDDASPNEDCNSALWRTPSVDYSPLGGFSMRLPIPEFKVTGSQLTQAEVESMLPKYSSPLEDYLEMYIQLGYVLLFSPVFTLSAFCALINNLCEIHVDSFKLCTSFQRPFAQRVESIGQWQAAMEVMGIVGVTVNCALISQSGLVQRLWPDSTFEQRVIFVVILEHIILAAKFLLSYAIPDVPNWITVEIAKTEFKRREAFRKLESQMVSAKFKDVTAEHRKSTTDISINGGSSEDKKSLPGFRFNHHKTYSNSNPDLSKTSNTQNTEEHLLGSVGIRAPTSFLRRRTIKPTDL